MENNNNLDLFYGIVEVDEIQFITPYNMGEHVGFSCCSAYTHLTKFGTETDLIIESCLFDRIVASEDDSKVEEILSGMIVDEFSTTWIGGIHFPDDVNYRKTTDKNAELWKKYGVKETGPWFKDVWKTVKNDNVKLITFGDCKEEDVVTIGDEIVNGTDGCGLEFTGSGGITYSKMTGDLPPVKEVGVIRGNDVTLSKIADIKADRLIVRDNGTGPVEELTVDGITFSKLAPTQAYKTLGRDSDSEIVEYSFSADKADFK